MSTPGAGRGGGGEGPLRAAIVSSLLLATGVAGVAGQEEPCRDRASLEVTVLDESGTIAMPGAMLVLHWSDVEERALRETAEGDGRFFICVPSGAREAVLWAELGDHSSEQATLTFAPGEAHEVELRILLAEVSPGRLIGRVYDAQTNDPVATAAVSVMVNGRHRVAESNRKCGGSATLRSIIRSR